MKKNMQKIGLSAMVLALGLSVVPATTAVTGGSTSVIQAEAASYRVTHSLKTADHLKTRPSILSSSIMKLPKGAKVIVKRKVGAYSYVQVNNKYGYIKSSNLKMLPSRYA